MTEKTGKFFVLEGIDGSGGETQAHILIERFKEQGHSAIHLTYPDYSGPIAGVIHEYLHNKYEFSKEVQFLLFFADYLKDKEKIATWLQQGNVIIADRYITSALAYQCFQGVPLEHALEVAKLFELPVPQRILLLDISAETSTNRKHKEKDGNLDRYESNKQFLADSSDFYKKLAQKNVFAPWQIINGEQSIEQVTEALWQAISPQLD